MNKEQHDWLVKEVRRIHSKWQPKRSAAVKARVSRGKYKCAKCAELFGPRFIDIDHIEPVIEVGTGFVDWNTYFARCFLQENEYQVLCKKCHIEKTVEENSRR